MSASGRSSNFSFNDWISDSKTTLTDGVLRLGYKLIDEPERELDDYLSNNGNPTKIPRTVYQTWETRRLGRRHFNSVAEFRNLNRDFSFLLFDRVERDRYMEERWGDHKIYQVYSRATFGPIKADVFRYCRLFDSGGFYFDISKGLTKPINQVYDGVSDFFLCLEGNHQDSDKLEMNKLGLPQKLFLQWGMGFSASHELLANMIDLVVNDYKNFKNQLFDDPKKAILEFTGPVAFSRAAYAYFESHPQLSRRVLGVDFNGHGIYAMRGSGYRHLAYPSYANSGPAVIVR